MANNIETFLDELYRKTRGKMDMGKGLVYTHEFTLRAMKEWAERDKGIPSATQIATDFIQEMMCDEIEPKAKGNIHPITEDVLKEWFIQIGVRNGNDR